MTSTCRATVVVPAHNEGAVIARCLSSVAEDPVASDLQVVVAVNGSSDDTASVARSFSGCFGQLDVIEIDEASKIIALNAGDAVATGAIRIYLDADIELKGRALSQLIALLDVECPRVAAPALAVDVEGCRPSVRAFYNVFSRLPYVQDHLVGLGVYGLSPSGRRRFDRFPDVTGDDLFVQSLFVPEETMKAGGEFVVRAPHTLRDLLAVRTRVAQGNAQLHRSSSTGHDAAASTRATVRALARMALRSPELSPAVLLYGWVSVLARRRASTSPLEWHKDYSSRFQVAVERSNSPPTGQLRVAYLVSQYPLVSHTFIEREVQGLRARGAQVDTFSVRPVGPDQLLSGEMREEAASTATLLASRRTLFKSSLALAIRQPRIYADAASRALRTGEASLKGRLWQLFYLVEAVHLFSLLRQRGLRHVHVHFSNNSADIARLVVHLGRRLDGAKSGWVWSLTVHGPTEFERVEKVDLPAKLESADGVACISEYARGQVMRHLPPAQWSKLRIVHMSVDLASYSYIDRRRPQAAPLRVLYVGRLVPEKGSPVLIEALAIARARGIDVECRLVGAGVLGDELMRLIRARGLDQQVHLMGAIGQDRLLEQYSWADIFCLPSFAEGLPVVLMEAMATGLPVITTAIAGTPELVEDDVTGRLVKPGSPEEIASALVEYRDPERRRATGLRGRSVVAEAHSLEMAARDQEHFLRAVRGRDTPQ